SLPHRRADEQGEISSRPHALPPSRGPPLHGGPQGYRRAAAEIRNGSRAEEVSVPCEPRPMKTCEGPRAPPAPWAMGGPPVGHVLTPRIHRRLRSPSGRAPGVEPRDDALLDARDRRQRLRPRRPAPV